MSSLNREKALSFRITHIANVPWMLEHGLHCRNLPDFIVRTTDGIIWLVETKGREELDLPQKMARLKQWCADATAAEAAEGGTPGRHYDFLFVDQTGFEKHAPKTFAALTASFMEYK